MMFKINMAFDGNLTLSQKFLKIAYSYFIFSSVDKLQIKTLIWPYEPAWNGVIWLYLLYLLNCPLN
jgi:hypothetical protein